MLVLLVVNVLVRAVLLVGELGDLADLVVAVGLVTVSVIRGGFEISVIVIAVGSTALVSL